MALRTGFLPYEMDGIFLHAQDVRELNAYLRRLAGYNHILGHELLRCRWQLKAGYAPLSGVVLPFRRFQEKKEEFCDE
nr:hypothetical protein [Bartonella massiliensis]